MKIVSASELKTNFDELLREVEIRGVEIIIRRNNRDVACLIPYESYRSRKVIDYAAGLTAIRSSVRGKV